MSPKEMLENTKLNWSVRQEEIVTKSGIEIPGRIAIVREDTNTVLGDLGAGYGPYQNIELMELLHKVTQSTGLELHSSGLFDGGKKVWIQLKSDDLVLGTDRVEGYLSGINSFDGSTNLSFGNANLTISCQNTFWRGYKQLNTKVRHTAGMRIRIEDILENLDVLLKEEKTLFAEIARMNSIGFTPNMLDLVKKRLFDVEIVDHVVIEDEISTRKKNQLFRFEQDLKTELENKDNSVWGLFSGVTRYTTHSASKEAEKNHQNKMFGKMGMVERGIFNELSHMSLTV